jgi:nitrite reductase (NADH) small subunit
MAIFSLIDAELVPPGKAAEVVADGKVLGVFNVDGTYHVLDGICPHAGGPLALGQLRGNIVTCPWHGWQFDVSTGQHCLNSRLCQRRYEARVEDGKVVAEISESSAQT